MITHKSRLEFASHPANLASVREFVRSFLSRCDWPDADTSLVVLGIDEACSNIIRHAYHQQENEPITLDCERLADGLCFRLRDYGEPCDPSKMQSRSLEKVRPGGLGIYLIQRVFDDVEYRSRACGTELTLRKSLPISTRSTPSPQA